MLYLSLRHYEYAVAVSKAGSMSAAAQVLNVSQPSLSVAIKNIETHLGQPLFLRGRGVPIRPTGFALGFLERAEALLAQAAALENPKTVEAARHLRFGCSFDLAPAWLASSMRVLRKVLPDVQMVPEVSDFETLAAQVASGHLDCALTYDLGLDASFEKDAVVRVQPHAFFSKNDPLSQAGSVSLAQLAERPLVLCDEGLSIRHMVSLFAGQGLRPTIAHRVASLEVMRSFAGNDEGVGISYSLPSGQHSYDGTNVAQVPIVDEVAAENIVVAYRADMAAVAPIKEVVEALASLQKP